MQLPPPTGKRLKYATSAIHRKGDKRTAVSFLSVTAVRSEDTTVDNTEKTTEGTTTESTTEEEGGDAERKVRIMILYL